MPKNEDPGAKPPATKRSKTKTSEFEFDEGGCFVTLKARAILSRKGVLRVSLRERRVLVSSPNLMLGTFLSHWKVGGCIANVCTSIREHIVEMSK